MALQAAVEWLSHLREHLRPLRLTPLAALLRAREREVTDTLIDLVIVVSLSVPIYDVLEQETALP